MPCVAIIRLYHYNVIKLVIILLLINNIVTYKAV